MKKSVFAEKYKDGFFSERRQEMKENNHSAKCQLLNSLKEMAQKIAEQSHCGEKDFSFEETAEELQIDFPALLRQSLAEVLAMRKDVETAEYSPADVPYQPDITVRTKPLQKLWLVSPLKIALVSEEAQYIPDYEILGPEEAVWCQREINTFIEQSAEPEEEHRGLMAYYPKNSALVEKIFSTFPCVGVIDGNLMGIRKCQVCGKLTHEELTELKSWWTAFMQTTILYIGLLTFQEHPVLALGICLSADEVPRVAQMFGMDTTTHVNMVSISSAVSMGSRAVRLIAGAP